MKLNLSLIDQMSQVPLCTKVLIIRSIFDKMSETWSHLLKITDNPAILPLFIFQSNHLFSKEKESIHYSIKSIYKRGYLLLYKRHVMWYVVWSITVLTKSYCTNHKEESKWKRNRTNGSNQKISEVFEFHQSTNMI